MRGMILPLLIGAIASAPTLAGDPQPGVADVVAGRHPADTPNTPPPDLSGDPVATVSLTGGTVAVGIGYVWGHGDVIFNGKKYSFKVKGVSVLDVGSVHLSASGVVYNLKDIADFSGGYSAATAGVTVGGGGSAAILQNEHGVVIKLLSTTEGLRFNLAANGVSIKVTDK